MHNLLIGLQIVFAIILVVAVLMQPGKTDGLNFISGGATDSFYSKNKSRTREAMLVRLTIVCAVAFGAISIALNLVK